VQRSKITEGIDELRTAELSYEKKLSRIIDAIKKNDNLQRTKELIGWSETLLEEELDEYYLDTELDELATFTRTIAEDWKNIHDTILRRELEPSQIVALYYGKNLPHVTPQEPKGRLRKPGPKIKFQSSYGTQLHQ
jgi:hypothetical protein